MKFNTWKQHYWHSVTVMKNRIEEIVRMANCSGKTVLEIGCNEGFLSKALLEDGGIVTSADYDTKMIEAARDNFGIEAVQADINALPFENQSFDIAISGETLEHINNPINGLKELFRVAREKIIITLPVGEYWLGELTHQWELEGEILDHDSAEIVKANKHILILCWTRRRDENFVDIPPFSTKELKEKYKIN